MQAALLTTLALFTLTYALAVPIEARADANCPPLAPYLVSSDPASPWNSICTAYDVSWANACNRGTGPDPIPQNYRPCSDPVWQV